MPCPHTIDSIKIFAKILSDIRERAEANGNLTDEKDSASAIIISMAILHISQKDIHDERDMITCIKALEVSGNLALSHKEKFGTFPVDSSVELLIGGVAGAIES